MKILATILTGWICLLLGVCGETVSIKNEFLQFRADTTANCLTVRDFRTDRNWTASFDSCAGSSAFDDWQHIKRPQYEPFSLNKIEKAGAESLRLTVLNMQSGESFFLDAELDENIITFELSADSMDQSMSCIGLPPLFTADPAPGHLVFCDRSCGVLKDQADPEGYVNSVLSTYANTSCLDMPWVGMVDLQKGDGVMVLLETPLDSAMHLKKIGDKIWPQPLWKESLGKLSYPRRVSYRFSDAGGYVALAGMYREYQQEQGKLKTLAQKTAERPNVARLAGSPPIWADSNVFKFIQDARNLGVTRAVLATPERDRHRVKETEQLNRMGYLTTRYDSYSDILEGKTWFQQDDVQKTSYVLQPDGKPLKGWKTLKGVQFYSRSSAFALRAAKAYSGELIDGQGLNADFIDVMGAMDLFEDYHPEHTFDREQDMLNKRAVFKYYTDKSLVQGTEHGNDWCADLVDYTEGSLSGSLWWIPGKNKNGWNPGHLQRPVSRDDFSPLYLKYGVNPANRIPLWQLVYHDCLVSTWYWGDSPGWFYATAPEISEQKDLETLLYGALPLFWRDDSRGYGWSLHKDRWMESYYLTAKFHEAVFGQQMVSHQFLTGDRLVQKTGFKNGAMVLVNFRPENYQAKLNGSSITLPPNGFYAKAPGIEQGRILQDGTIRTFVKAKDLFYFKSNKAVPGDPLSIAGELVLFRLDDSRWNLLFRPADPSTRLDAAACGKFTGWGRSKIYPLAPDWETGGEISAKGAAPLLLNGGNYAITSGAATTPQFKERTKWKKENRPGF